MKTASIIAIGLTLCATATAQLVPADTAACMRSKPATTACFDNRLPVRLCIAEVEAALKEISAWDQCVADQMQERHNRERRALAERSEQLRASLLQSIVLMSK